MLPQTWSFLLKPRRHWTGSPRWPSRLMKSSQMRHRLRHNFRWVVGALIAITLPVSSQPPATSDSRQARQIPDAINPLSLPQRAPVYIPPQDDVFEVLVTNTRPVVVEVEVYSNVVRRTIWYQRGQLRTNDMILSTNLLSRSTNSVPTLTP